MRNIRLTLAYDGSNYVGWQVQPNGVSVQAVVEKAIFDLTGEQSKVIAAGRTDSGVHALGQVANFESESTIPADKFPAALQQYLPHDIVVGMAEEVAADFHATYSAKSKRYRYVIHNSRVNNPFIRNYAYHYCGELDSVAMHQAAQELLGTHDFRCFESHFPNKATSVRTIREAKINRYSECPICYGEFGAVPEKRGLTPSCKASDPFFQPQMDGDFIWFDVVADGFLYNMVRAIVGTLIKVGRHVWSGSDIRRIIENQNRSEAGDTAPAHGLYLVHVNYE